MGRSGAESEGSRIVAASRRVVVDSETGNDALLNYNDEKSEIIGDDGNLYVNYMHVG